MLLLLSLHARLNLPSWPLAFTIWCDETWLLREGFARKTCPRAIAAVSSWKLPPAQTAQSPILSSAPTPSPCWCLRRASLNASSTGGAYYRILILTSQLLTATLTSSPLTLDSLIPTHAHLSPIDHQSSQLSTTSRSIVQTTIFEWRTHRALSKGAPPMATLKHSAARQADSSTLANTPPILSEPRSLNCLNTVTTRLQASLTRFYREPGWWTLVHLGSLCLALLQ